MTVPMQRFAWLSEVLLVAAGIGAATGAGGCASPVEDRGDGERATATSGEALTATCTASVAGTTRDVETDYLPHVVHCENGGAPFEALKAQAVAARTFLYYKLETSGSIADGQGDQVYSCGSAPTAEQIRAVAETEGQVLRYENTTICSFFVAGGAASPPACHDAPSSTSGDVTYNEGLTGSAVHRSPLGDTSASNVRNRGCLSQLGSRCLADEGKSYDEILRFYYGTDIEIAQATGPCVVASPSGEGGSGGGDAGAPPRSVDSDAGQGSPDDGAAPDLSNGGGCTTAPTRGGDPRSTAWPVLAAFALLMAFRRRRSAPTLRLRAGKNRFASRASSSPGTLGVCRRERTARASHRFQ